MSKYRNRLPQLTDGLFLTDGGLETTLIFHDGMELPHFAAFPLLYSVDGRAAIRNYFLRYLRIAKEAGHGFVMEAPTWRASFDWGARLGITPRELAEINRDWIGWMREMRDQHETPSTPIVVSGCLGPRGDGYDVGRVMSQREAEVYHSAQIEDFALAGADMAAAFTMTNTNEAIGITRAAERFQLPVAISFTLETDGRLPTGQTLAEAIGEVDEATSYQPLYYMINCAHPTHFMDAFQKSEVLKRVRGIRANSSKRSHQELNDAPDLDMGDPVELGREYRKLMARHPQIAIIGGCCGTDHRHVEQMSIACVGLVHA
ncbi:MAG: homocysteine S-methyltransferase family protein [Acidobacteriota bacterium]